MDPLTMYMAGSVAAPVVGGLVGNIMSQGDRDAANRLRQQMMDMFGQIKVPTQEEQKIMLEQLKSQGQLTPELEQVFAQGDTAFKNIATDPRLKEAQLQALSSLQDVANNGGMTAADKSRQNQMLSEVNRNEQGNREAIMQDMARRGQAGSGNELAAQLMNQQASAERASQQGMDIKAQAEQRALEALMQGGQMAGNIRGQDFSEQAAAAQAQDAINRFNTQNRQSVMGANMDRRNDAQNTNLQSRQRIADTNVGIRNQQETHNKGLVQQQFQNQMQRAAGMSGQMGQMANAKDNAADRTAGMYAGIGAGVGEGFAEYGKHERDEKRFNALLSTLKNRGG
jgi:hypothetical protein